MYAMHYGKVPSESKFFKFESYAFPEAAAATTDPVLTVNNSSLKAVTATGVNERLELVRTKWTKRKYI